MSAVSLTEITCSASEPGLAGQQCWCVPSSRTRHGFPVYTAVGLSSSAAGNPHQPLYGHYSCINPCGSSRCMRRWVPKTLPWVSSSVLPAPWRSRSTLMVSPSACAPPVETSAGTSPALPPQAPAPARPVSAASAATAAWTVWPAWTRLPAAVGPGTSASTWWQETSR